MSSHLAASYSQPVFYSPRLRREGTALLGLGLRITTLPPRGIFMLRRDWFMNPFQSLLALFGNVQRIVVGRSTIAEGC